jgi:hypothetical protein
VNQIESARKSKVRSELGFSPAALSRNADNFRDRSEYEECQVLTEEPTQKYLREYGQDHFNANKVANARTLDLNHLTINFDSVGNLFPARKPTKLPEHIPYKAKTYETLK